MATYAARQRAIAAHPPLTVLTASGQMSVVRRAWYSKLGESATAGVIERAVVQRSNGNGVTPTARSEKYNTRSRASVALGQSWGTAPTVKGNPLVITDAGDKPSHINSWRPPRPWAAIYQVDADEVSIDATSVANTSTDYMLTWSEQDPGVDDRFIRGRRPRTAIWHYWASHTGPVKGVLPSTVPLQQQRVNWCQFLGRYGHSRPSPNTLWQVATGGGQTLALPVALETDSVLAFARAKSKSLPLALETDAVLALARIKTKAVSLASETDLALALTKAKVKALGLASETDLALALSKAKTRALGLASEVDLARAIVRNLGQFLAVPTALETDSVLDFVRAKAKALTAATGTNTALLIGATKQKQVPVVTEANLAIVPGKLKTKPLPLASETDLAVAIRRAGAVVTSVHRRYIQFRAGFYRR